MWRLQLLLVVLVLLLLLDSTIPSHRGEGEAPQRSSSRQGGREKERARTRTTQPKANQAVPAMERPLLGGFLRSFLRGGLFRVEETLSLQGWQQQGWRVHFLGRLPEKGGPGVWGTLACPSTGCSITEWLQQGWESTSLGRPLGGGFPDGGRTLRLPQHRCKAR